MVNEKRRVGKTLTVTLTVLTNEQALSLIGRDISLMMMTPLLQKKELDFEIVEENKVRFKMREHVVGTYKFSLSENWSDDTNATIVDFDQGIELVPATYMEAESGIEGLDVEDVKLSGGNIAVGIIGPPGKDGRDGKDGKDGERGYSGNINYPTFDIDEEGELIMGCDSAADVDRFELDENGELILKIGDYDA